MRVDILYEMVDLRHGETLPYPVVALRSAPGGLLVIPVDGPTPTVLEFDADDIDSFLDDEANGTVEVRTEQGRVVFSWLTLSLWHEVVGSRWGDDHPDFTTDEALQQFMWSKLKEG